VKEAIMADEQPKSRPEPPRPDGKGAPEDKDAIYGGQWGQSGKQNPEDPNKADPRSQPPGPAR
jgi:hypothetical protein